MTAKGRKVFNDAVMRPALMRLMRAKKVEVFNAEKKGKNAPKRFSERYTRYVAVQKPFGIYVHVQVGVSK